MRSVNRESWCPTGEADQGGAQQRGRPTPGSVEVESIRCRAPDAVRTVRAKRSVSIPTWPGACLNGGHRFTRQLHNEDFVALVAPARRVG